MGRTNHFHEYSQPIPREFVPRPKDIKVLCADDEGTALSWIACIRLAKYGLQLRDNYHKAKLTQFKLEDLRAPEGSRPTADVSGSCLVLSSTVVASSPSFPLSVWHLLRVMTSGAKASPLDLTTLCMNMYTYMCIHVHIRVHVPGCYFRTGHRSWLDLDWRNTWTRSGNSTVPSKRRRR